MTVIVVAEVPGQTEAGYDGMLEALADPIRRAEGFLLHSAYCVDGQWRVLEVWRSKADAARRWQRRATRPRCSRCFP